MKKLIRYLVFMLRIRRVEFRVAEIPIVAIPVLLLSRDASVLYSIYFWEGILAFFFLFAFGDMINCLADRDLDATYKPHLSESVYGLGLGFVRFQVAFSAVAAVVISCHISWRLGNWSLVFLSIAGLIAGAAYSVEPVRLKSRGILQLVCLWLIIFFGPMVFVAQLVNAELSWTVLVFSALYGALQMGIILVNTAEDYPEDRAAGVETSIVRLGLHRGIKLALYLTVIGSIGVISTLAWLYRAENMLVAKGVIAGLIPPLAACAFAILGIRGLNERISGKGLPQSIVSVKSAGKTVPVWVTTVAWSMLWAAGYLFYIR